MNCIYLVKYYLTSDDRYQLQNAKIEENALITIRLQLIGRQLKPSAKAQQENQEHLIGAFGLPLLYIMYIVHISHGAKNDKGI